MDAQELLRLIPGGESGRLEFKESFGDGVIETLVAMSNAGGGRVLAFHSAPPAARTWRSSQ